MSHDQKPGRMRVVGNAAPAPQRRRGDGGGSAGGALATGSASASAAAPVATARSAAPGRLLALLFVVGCAAGGAAFPLLGWW